MKCKAINHQRFLFAPRSYAGLLVALKQRGISLIEVMVAMAIMLIVLAAIVVTVSSTSLNSSVQQNLSRMMENGQLALNIISKNIRNAGFEELISVPSPVENRDRVFGQYLQGCDNATISADTDALPAWGASCISGGESDAIAVRYQGKQLHSLPALDSGSISDNDLKAVDCLGAEISASSAEIDRGDSKKITVVDNRFYVANNALVCRGNGGSGSTLALVENIESMKLWYGISRLERDNSGFMRITGQTEQYLTASEVKSHFASADDGWRRVTSVRICIIVRSSNPVPAPTHDYTNCNGKLITPKDNYLRQAMFTTVEVSNVAAGF